MELSIYLLKDENYAMTNDSIPIILKITSDTEIELSKKWNVNKVMLSINSKEIKVFYTAEVSYLNREFLIISKDEPKYLIIDINQFKDSLASIIPDEYQITIEILLYEIVDEEYKIHKLQTQTNISLK